MLPVSGRSSPGVAVHAANAVGHERLVVILEDECGTRLNFCPGRHSLYLVPLIALCLTAAVINIRNRYAILAQAAR